MFNYNKEINSNDERVLSELNIDIFQYANLSDDARTSLKAEYRRSYKKEDIPSSLLTQTSRINKPKIKTLIKKLTKR